MLLGAPQVLNSISEERLQVGHEMIRGSTIHSACVIGMVARAIARRGPMLVCGFVCGLAACPLFGQGQNPDEQVLSVESRHQAGEGKTGDVLQMRIPLFRVRNAPLVYVVQVLNALGVQVCYEAVIGENPWHGYVDQQGAIAFHADRLISLDLAGTSVNEVMDRIVKADPRYTWSRVPSTNVLNLVPKASRLGFQVGPVNMTGNPVWITSRLGRNPAWKILSPPIIRGGHFPDVTLSVQRCTARELLNQMARQHAGLAWYCVPSGTNFGYVPDAVAKQVMLVYPELTPGEPTDLTFRYDIVWDHITDGVATVIVKKTALAGK